MFVIADHVTPKITDEEVMYTLNSRDYKGAPIIVYESGGVQPMWLVADTPVPDWKDDEVTYALKARDCFGTTIIIMDSVGGQHEYATESNVCPTLKETHYKFPPVICKEDS